MRKALAYLLLAATVAFAGQYMYVADDSVPALIVQYEGTNTPAIIVADNAISLIDGATTNTITLGTSNVSRVVGLIEAVTNAAGDYIWDAELGACLGTETLASNIITVSRTVLDETGRVGINWDSSDVDAAFILVAPLVSGYEPYGETISQVNYYVAGTGATHTVEFYHDTTAVFTKTDWGEDGQLQNVNVYIPRGKRTWGKISRQALSDAVIGLTIE